MAWSVRRVLFGRPLETARARHERLGVFLGLAVFSSDVLSSVAYATEEILLALVAVSVVAALHYVVPISIAIAALLAVVSFSYRQTIHAYPNGGGSYIVAKDNLGTLAGLTAAAALLVDYVLTVAVSVVAGVAALISAFPIPLADPHPVFLWWNYRVWLSIASVLLIALANLRGVRESGAIFAVPTYSFIGSMLLLIGVGMFRLITGHLGHAAAAAPISTGQVGLFLLLKAFSSGCAALTGTEAISNGVPAFREPESKNAATTLSIMAVILGTFFMGISILARAYGAVPDTAHGETVLSVLGHAVFGNGLLYYLLQFATCAILVVAANTAFADFPRLSMLLARDRFIPRQFSNIGDRLVFNNGIILLALVSILLILGFGGITHHLIPLYAVGVFLSFTLSQFGMVKRWLRRREQGWQRSALVNGIGGAATAVVLLVIAATKFWPADAEALRVPLVGIELRMGAWIVVGIIPCMVAAFLAVHRHYERVAAALSMESYEPPPPLRNTVLVLVNTIHRGIMPAIHYARSIGDDVRGVYVEVHPEKTPEVLEKWQQWVPDIPLIILPSPYRSLSRPFLEYVDQVEAEREDDIVTVLIPEFDTEGFLAGLLHNQSGLRLKLALLSKPAVVVANIRYHLRPCPARHVPSHLFQEPPADAARPHGSGSRSG
jgi:amino acid transporter